MRVSFWLAAACVGGAFVLFAACDSAPGPEAFSRQPPVLSDFTFSPQAVVLEQLPPEQIEDDVVVVPLDLSVVASDPDGGLAEVSFVVQSPLSSFEPLATGALSSAGSNRYTASTTLRIPKAAVGVYTVLVYAVDTDQLLSGEVRGQLRFVATGRPPVIESVEADPEVVRPPTTLRLVATVSDPDGLANISRVEVTTPNGQAFPMFDDGVRFDDEVAGDGRYTAAFDVPSATPGTQTFTFQATDRSGLTSNIFEKQITIE